MLKINEFLSNLKAKLVEIGTVLKRVFDQGKEAVIKQSSYYSIENYKRNSVLKYHLFRVLSILLVLNLIAFALVPVRLLPVYSSIYNYSHNYKVKSDADVEKIFNDLKKLLPSEGRDRLRVYVVKTPVVNAFVTESGAVFINQGIIDFTNGDAGAIAAVLGHEISHDLLTHNRDYAENANDPETVNAWHELMADDMGLLLAKSAGYNGCNAEATWLKFDDQYGSEVFTGSHPTNIFRAVNFAKMCNRLQ